MKKSTLGMTIVSAVALLIYGFTPNQESAIDTVQGASSASIENQSMSSQDSEPATLAALDQHNSPTSSPENTVQMEPSVKARYYANTFASTAEYENASMFGQLPAHMRDVALEELAFDEQGELIIDDSVKRVFEFFLLAKDQEGLDQTHARLREYLELTLPEPAREQAIQLSERYLAYKENLKNQQFSNNTNLSDEANLQQIKIALDERKRVRREYLGEANSSAIFGYEEQYDDFSFRRLEINANKDISFEEKQNLIAQAEMSLPEELGAKMRYKREQKNLEYKIVSLQQTEGNEAEIFELRKAFYGEKAAQRMAYLEDNSPDWQQRVQRFYEQETEILEAKDLSSEQKAAHIQQLKHDSFSYKEQVKLAVQGLRG